jgi:hypothetical protein
VREDLPKVGILFHEQDPLSQPEPFMCMTRAPYTPRTARAVLWGT